MKYFLVTPKYSRENGSGDRGRRPKKEKDKTLKNFFFDNILKNIVGHPAILAEDRKTLMEVFFLNYWVYFIDQKLLHHLLETEQ